MSEATGEPTLDLSFGRQEFRIGNGFLIYDRDLDQLEKNASWLSPRDSFERAGLVRLDMAPAHADLFYLNADRDHDETALAGFNFEYAFQDPTRVGFTYLYIFDSTPRFWGVRAGMNVLDLRVNELPLPYLPEISFSGEQVKEIGDGKDGEIDAEGWYAGLTYAPAEWPWTPSLSYRYSSFSADPDPNDTIRRDFDPPFYGWTGWGTWYQGEITGEWLLFNSNQRTNLVHLKLAPREDLSVGILYFKFWLADNDYLGTPVTDGDFTDEVNLYADWTLTDYASISAVYGAAFPGEAARQAFGDDEVYHLFEVVLYLTF
ncbi:MAG: alginate export family protein [Pseudomonadota bacterium]|nr:alginate export family protein [Pseudomonadota bacterium]